MSDRKKPAWLENSPSAFDIVTCWFPDSLLVDTPGKKLRPCLVTRVLRLHASDQIACIVAFGTSQLKLARRLGLDLIVRRLADLDEIGLPTATRFDLDTLALLPWDDRFFGCWSGFTTPVTGQLTEPCIKEYAYLMMRRFSV